MRSLLAHTILLLALTSLAAAQENEPGEEPMELEAGKLRLAIETGGHSSLVLKVLFTADSKQLVSVGKDQSVRYWDVDTGELRRTVYTSLHVRPEGHNQAVAYAPGGLVAFCGQYIKARDERPRPYVLFNPGSGQIEKKLEFAGAPGQLSLALSPDGKQLATGHYGGARVWDVATGALVHELKLPQSWMISVAFTSDGKRVAALARNGHVHVFNVAAAKVGKRKQANLEVVETREAHLVLWSADDRQLLVATQEGIDVWNPQTGAKIKSMPIGKTNAMAWDAERRTLLTGGQGPKGKRPRVSILDVDSGRQTHFPSPALEPPEAFDVAFSPDGKLVAAVVHERVIYVWPRDGRKRQATMGAIGRPPLSAAWDGDGKTIVWTSRPDPKDDDEEKPSLQHSFNLAELTLLHGGRRKAKEGPKKEGPKKEGPKKEGPRGLQRAVLDENDITLNIEKATVVRDKKKVKLDTRFGANTCGTLLPGDRVVINNTGGGLQLLDAKTGKRTSVLLGHSEAVTDMAPSPDRRYLLSASPDQTLKIWDVAQPGQERLLLTLFVRGRDWVIWTPEGYYAATPRGEELMGGTIDNSPGEVRTFLPAERFRNQLYRPDVIQHLLEKGSVAEALKAANEVRKVQNIAIPRGEARPEKLLPPSVVVEVVKKDLPKITFKVSAEQGCPEQPIKSLRLFVDGRPLPSELTRKSFDSGKEVARYADTWEAEVPPGRHTLTVMARSKDDTPSFSNPIVFDTPLPEADRPVIRHVAVGVSKYDRPNWNLRAAHSDAEQLADAISAATRTGKLYRTSPPKKLVDPDATCENVRQAIKDVRQAAKPSDLFVFSFAGHGVREEGEFFLMTREADPTSAETLKKTALSGKELRAMLTDFPCQVLVLLDACHSGEVVKYRPGSDEAARTLADVDVRVAVMCAALAHEEAIERNGGLFTAAIVKALKREGEVFFDKETGELNVYHLQAFVYQEVTKASDAQQTPYLKMPLAQPAFVVAKFVK